MAKKKKAQGAKKSDKQAANLGFEAKLWLAADKLRSNMDGAEYKHVVLGLVFLKYISDAFEEMRAKHYPKRFVYLALKQIPTNEVESRTLAALRDTLLPKLLTGELDVSAAAHAEPQLELTL